MPDQTLGIPLYESDHYAGALAQAAPPRRLAAARPAIGLDLENLAEEVEALARSDRHAVESHAERVIEHFLKLEHPPARDPRDGWRETVQIQRNELARKLTASLRNHLLATLEQRYQAARRVAVIGLERDGVRPERLPSACPYSLDQILDPDWWPQNRHGRGGPQQDPSTSVETA